MSFHYEHNETYFWNRVIGMIKSRLRIEGLTPDEKRFLRRLLWMAENGRTISQEELVRAKNIGVRNPEFPGDMMGRPDDDFFDDDEDDEEDETTTNDD